MIHCLKHPPKTECGCLQGGETENGRTGNPLTQWTVLCNCIHHYVQGWVHILGDPQCSAQERYYYYYNNNNNNYNNCLELRKIMFKP